MKIVKVIVVAILLLVAIVLVVGAFAPKKFHVARSITINAPVEQVWEQVNYFKNFNNWSPWYALDTNQTVEIEGVDGEVGSVMKWSSEVENVGTGSQTKIVVEEYTAVENELRFGGFDMVSIDRWELSGNEDSTFVTWSIRGDLDFQSSILFFLMNPDKMMGPDFEQGLQNLKEYVESMEPVSKEQPILTKTLESYPVITIREKTTDADLPATLGKLYGELMAYANEQGLEVEGKPFAAYHEWNPPSVDVEAGLATKTLAKKTDRINAYKTDETEVVYISHFGSYESSEASHMVIGYWMEENKREAAGPPFEVYVSDPDSEPDTTKWQTDIYYPLK